MDWMNTLKDWWWFAALIAGALVTLARYSVRLNKASEELKRVAEHDRKLVQITEQYDHIKDDTEGLKTGLQDLHAALDRHVVEQKEDIRAMTAALYSILDKLKDMGGNGEIAAAHQELRKHTLNK